MSREITMPKPASEISQPITSSESGMVCVRESISAGPCGRLFGSSASSPATSTAAAPSPNRAEAIRFDLVRSFGMKVRPHSSTTTTRIRAVGTARAISIAREREAAPPAHPSPQMGRRFTSRRNGSSSMSRASMLGVESPVVETNSR